MQKNLLTESKHVYFIGLGGIGVSAVARMMLHDGKYIAGSDISSSEITDELVKLGVHFDLGQSADFVPVGTDLVIYSPAITVYDPKLLDTLKERNIMALSYPQALHELSKDKYTIAISGTHGKTTTTAMVAKIMMDAGLDPTVIVGSLLKDTKSNFIAGKSKYFVVEACEYKRSFLDIEPTIAAVTNIDNDHLDYYKDIADIQSAFHTFVKKVPKNGFIVCSPKDKNIAETIMDVNGKIVDQSTFKTDSLHMKVPGNHNRRNASTALAIAHIVGIEKNIAEKSLEEFSGTWRRFEYKGITKEGIIVYDDYAHHPTEIRATLAGAREFFGEKKSMVVFQPHLYSRTKLLLADFANAFGDADQVIIAPIYAAREILDPSITSRILAEKLKNPQAISFDTFAEIEAYLSENLKKDDVLLTMGAGDIYKVGEDILK